MDDVTPPFITTSPHGVESTPGNEVIGIKPRRKMIEICSASQRASAIADVYAHKFLEVGIAFVFELVVDADFRGVVGVRDAEFQFDEELLFRPFKVRFLAGHPRQNGDSLIL
jgi:hypothetical protein